MTSCWKLGLLLFLVASLTAQQTVQYTYDDAGRLIVADYGGGSVINYSYDDAGNLLRREVTSGARFVSVSAASFASGQALAETMIAAGFGSGLATGTVLAKETPLPTELLGTRVEITDSEGTSHRAPLFFVSAGQINYLIPDGTALGLAQVKVVSGTGAEIAGSVQINPVSPGLFTANSQGTGVAAALYLRVNPDDSREQELLFNPKTGQGVPLDVRPESGQVFLLLFVPDFAVFKMRSRRPLGERGFACWATPPFLTASSSDWTKSTSGRCRLRWPGEVKWRSSSPPTEWPRTR